METKCASMNNVTSPIFNPSEAECWTDLISQYDYYIRAELAVEMFIRDALLDVIHNDNPKDKSYDGLPRDPCELNSILLAFKINKQYKLKGNVSAAQWDIMCTATGQSCSELFDVTTQLVIIRNKLNLKPSVDWSSKVVPNPKNRADYCILARELRNDVKHGTIRNIFTRKQFEEIWDRILKILKGLGYTKLDKFYLLKIESLDGRVNQVIMILQKKFDALEKTTKFLEEIVKQDAGIIEINEVHKILLKDTQEEKVKLETILKSYEKKLEAGLTRISEKFEERKIYVDERLQSLRFQVTGVKDEERKLKEQVENVENEITKAKADAEKAIEESRKATQQAEEAAAKADEARHAALTPNEETGTRIEDIENELKVRKERADELKRDADDAEENRKQLIEQVEILKNDLLETNKRVKQAEEKERTATTKIFPEMSKYWHDGEEIALVGSVDEKFRCPLCLKLMCKPVKTIRDKMACKDCYKILEGNICPIDQHVITNEEVTEDVHTQRDIMALPCYCENKYNGCNWKGKISDVKEHQIKCTHPVKRYYQTLAESNVEKDKEIEELKKKISTFDGKFKVLELFYQNTSYNGHQIWKIVNCSDKLKQAASRKAIALHSPPCYTKRSGYKFCARLYLTGYGSNDEFVCICFVLMMADYDAILEWPFHQNITIRLIDPNHTSQTITKIITPDDSASFNRPPRKMNPAYRVQDFVKRERLHEFITGDMIFIEIIVDPLKTEENL